MRSGLSAWRNPSVWVPAGLHLLLSIWLCFVPLFDNLGFERAFATGLLAAITGPIVALSLLHERRGSDPGLIFLEAAGLNLLLLLPTAIAGLVVELGGTVCEPSSGLGFLLLLAGGNVVFGSALAVGAGAISERRLLPGLAITLVLLLHLVAALLRLYREPQVFVYSLPFGYWPGSIYDEELQLNLALVAARARTVLIAAGLVFVARLFSWPGLRPWQPKGMVVSALLAALSFGMDAWIQWNGQALGFDLDRSAITEELSRQAVTEHFEIYVDPALPAEQLEALVQDHEFRWAQLSAFFGRSPAGKIRSFLYADVAQKGRLMGAKNTQIARPWAKEIHLNGYDFPHPVLKHELAHIFAAELASGPFKVPTRAGVLVNIGVVEGVAVAADWRVQELTVHEWTKAMRALNLAPDLRRSLDLAGFWSLSSAKAYTAAGSFLRWLADERGIDKLAVLYDKSDFFLAYGEPLEVLVGQWEQYIDALPLPETDLLVAEHRFKQPAIFQKVCAHRSANLAAAGQRRLAGGDLEGGRAALLELLSYGGDPVGPLLSIAEAEAKRGELAQAEALLDQALGANNASERSLAAAREAKGNLAWRRGDLEAARAAFQEVLRLHLSTSADRLQHARLALLLEPPEVQVVLRSYLLGELSPPAALVRLGAMSRAHPDDPLLHYLYGKALENQGLHPEGIEEMRAALLGPLPAESLTLEAQASLGRMLLRAGRSEEARWAFEALATQSKSEGARLEALDWAARATFALTKALPRPE